MQPPPLQVDTVTSGWDILGALGDFFGGIFAGGALLIAAIAYMRQVEDHRRAQAASISLTLTPPVVRQYMRTDGQSGPTEPSINPTVKLENLGTSPVYRARLVATYQGGRTNSANIAQMLPGGASLTSPLDGEVINAQLEFVDAGGRCWIRTDAGMLVGDEQMQRSLRLPRLGTRGRR